MLRRHLTIPLHRSVQAAGPVLLQGPRGSGKTTLVKQEFPGRLFIDMNESSDRAKAQRDPAAFLASLRRPAVVDELQRSPELVSYLRDHPTHLPIVFVTNLRLPLPMNALELHPPTRSERLRRPSMPLELLGRFVPSAQDTARVHQLDSEAFPPSREFLWRDVPLMVRLHDQDCFERFVALVEMRSGQPLQQQELARELDIAHRTVVRWLEVLDACFLTLRLDPLDQRTSRRLVRRSKLHFLGASSSFETEVVSEIYRNARHAGVAPALSYWRDSNGLEVPLIVQIDPDVAVVPCGIAPVPGASDDERLLRWMRLNGVSHGAMIGRNRAPLQRRASGVLRYASSDF